MNVKKSDTIGSIVTSNLHAATIFNYYGIDFYSHGDRTLEHACIGGNVSIESLFEDLWQMRAPVGNNPNFDRMGMTELSTYILRTHHRYTEKMLVFIKHTMDRLAGHYEEEHPNLPLIKKEFQELSVYLTVHMNHEEFIIFPYIQKMAQHKINNASVFQIIERPISAMREDHDKEVQSLITLADLTNHYAIPNNGGYPFQVTYSAMKELEEDLKIHMHLENNILFPKAIDFAHQMKNNLN